MTDSYAKLKAEYNRLKQAEEKRIGLSEYERGRAEERAAIVAVLGDSANCYKWNDPRHCAAWLERGEHIKEPNDA